jgi:hypothetical protein
MMVVIASLAVTFLVLSLVLGRISPQHDEFVYELPPLAHSCLVPYMDKDKGQIRWILFRSSPFAAGYEYRNQIPAGIRLLERLEEMGPLTQILFGIPAEPL